jgi:hypothetical protein
LAGRAWRPAGAGGFQVDPRDRALQYRVRFLSPNGDRFPVLRAIAVSLRR